MQKENTISDTAVQKKCSAKDYWKIFGVFTKLGMVGFGGGNALIPIFEKELVEKQGWMDEDEYYQFVAFNSLIPGAMPIKFAICALMRRFGMMAAILGAIAVTLPTSLISFLLLTLLYFSNPDFISKIELGIAGCSMFIIALMFMFVRKILQKAKKNGYYKISVIVFIGAFLLTCENNVRSLFTKMTGIAIPESIPVVFNVTMLDLMLTAFLFVIIMSFAQKKWVLYLAGAIIALYLIDVGKNGWFPAEWSVSNWCIWALVAIALVLAVVSYRQKSTSAPQKLGKIPYLREGLVTWGVSFLVSFVVVALIPILVPNAPFGEYFKIAMDSYLSSVVCWGNYIPISEAFFVTNGPISSEVFFNRIYAVANVLPGANITKVTTGVGFVQGLEHSYIGAVLYSILGSNAGMFAGIQAGIMMVLGFEKLKGSKMFDLLDIYIRPIFCGAIISTVISLLLQGINIANKNGISGVFATLFLIALLIFNFVSMIKKWKLNDVVLLFGSGVVSFCVFTAVGMMM
ncbi:chromate transporter [uncultured Ruthenibacterium sp.]|uniref:chromate transporter n=1 Tax=uncultured Ruthenibacterium sp. TaxID=1905347 RepID=UPI00349E75CD